MVKEITVANPGPLVPLGEESVVSDFSYDADRLAVGSQAAALVRIHDRNRGGSGQWGRPARSSPPARAWPRSANRSPSTGTGSPSPCPPLRPRPARSSTSSRTPAAPRRGASPRCSFPPAGSPQGFATSLAADPRFPYLVIGATGQAPDDKNGVPEIPGKAFVYSINSAGDTLSLLDELGGSAAEGHGFGGSVANSTVTRIVVGNAGFAGRGKTFTYNATDPVPDWSLFHTREGGVPGDGLGLAVAALPLFTFSAAPWSDVGGTDAGAGFIDRSGSYELWAANQGPGFTEWFPEQDPDGDGLTNLGEFGLGGNPLSASSRPPLTMVRTPFVNGATSWPALRWDPPVLPYPVGMLRYQMQRSTTLQSWSDTTPDGGTGLGDPVGNFFRIEFPREFFRIDFRYPAPPVGGGSLFE